jgi:hypothetical protein
LESIFDFLFHFFEEIFLDYFFDMIFFDYFFISLFFFLTHTEKHSPLLILCD